MKRRVIPLIWMGIVIAVFPVVMSTWFDIPISAGLSLVFMAIGMLWYGHAVWAEIEEWWANVNIPDR